MANSTQILDKIERNMGQRGLAANLTRTDAETITITGGTGDLIITYDPKEGFGAPVTGANPMLGVDDSTSPYLGIGVAGAGSIRLSTAAVAEAAMFDTVDKLNAFAEAAGFANDIVLESSGGDTRIAGQCGVLGLGE